MNIWLFNHYAVPPALYPLARPAFLRLLEILFLPVNHRRFLAAGEPRHEDLPDNKKLG